MLARVQGVLELVMGLAQVVHAGVDPPGGGGEVVADPLGEESVLHRRLRAQPRRRGRGGRRRRRRGLGLQGQRMQRPDPLARVPGSWRRLRRGLGAAAHPLVHREPDPEQRHTPNTPRIPCS